jgi:hypothetical protein
MGLLRTILVIIIVYYAIRLFTRYILPSLFVGYMDKKMNEFSKQQMKQQQRKHQQAQQREGEVTIDYKPGDPSKNKPSKGDYVDYVEVKE